MSDAFFALYAMDEFLEKTPKTDEMYQKIARAKINIEENYQATLDELGELIKKVQR